MRLVAALFGVLFFWPHALAGSPSDGERKQWLDIQKEAIEDPDDPARLEKYLGLLGRSGDDYLVDGDLLMSRDEVQRYLRRKKDPGGANATGGGFGSELIVEIVDGKRAIWPQGDRILTYAVSRASFPNAAWYASVVAGMNDGAAAWEFACQTCGVDFQHIVEADDRPSPDAVRFIVKFRLPVHPDEATIRALAFFPSDPPEERTLWVLPAFFYSSEREAILMHELGHVLGYRHEHILSSEAGCAAFRADELLEDPTFEPVSETHETPKPDQRSIMHYPCGENAKLLPMLSGTDKTVHATIYGAPP